MKNNVTEINFKKPFEFPDNILESAKGNYESVFIVGYSKEGCLDVRSTNDLNHADINWLLSVVQNKLVNGDYSG